MQFRYKRTVAPTTTPITLAEAKAQLREVDDDYDAEITTMIAAATEYLDGPFGVLGRCMVTQTWTVGVTFPRGVGPYAPIPIHLGHLQSVSSITYRDPAGVTQTLDPSAYEVITGEGGVIYPTGGNAWPQASDQWIDPVTITVVVGYPTDGSSPAEDGLRANIPAGLRHAIKLLVSHFFEHRDVVAFGVSVTEIPKSVDALIAPYRITKHGGA